MCMIRVCERNEGSKGMCMGWGSKGMYMERICV